MKISDIIELVGHYKENKKIQRPRNWGTSVWTRLVLMCRSPHPRIKTPNTVELSEALFFKTASFWKLDSDDKLAYLICKFYLREHIWKIGNSVSDDPGDFQRKNQWLDENVNKWHFYRQTLISHCLNGSNNSYALYAFKKREDALRFKISL